jgi:hypothetical protein
MPVFLIAFTEQLRSTATDRSSRIALTCAAASGLAVSWLHPWQGETLALAALGLVLWSRPPRGRLAPCALAVGALAAPLIYYYLLSRLDGGWELAYEASRSVYTGRPLAALLPVFAPVAILAAFGVRRNELDDPLACTLVLWPASTLAVYLASPTFPPHVLTGVALPLAILAVRGWQRIVPTSRPGVAVLLIAAATVPGVLAIGEITRQDLRSSAQSAILEPGERKALSYLERRPEPGGVIAANGIAAAVPGLTGKPVWSGHPQWTADFDARRATSAQLFAGQLRGAPARDLISGTGVRWLVADCAGGRDLTTTVGATTLRRMSFGCAAVYEIRRPAGGTDP